MQVTVEWALGATQLYQNPVSGTLLSELPVEPLVPLQGLVELGHTITTPNTRKHPVLLSCGCPVVQRDGALALIHAGGAK